MPNIFRNSVRFLKNTFLGRWVMSAFVLIVSSLLVLGGVAMTGQDKANADNPTFFFSDSSACVVKTALPKVMNKSLTLYLCMDAKNEGTGLLGTEVNVSYPSSNLHVTSISFWNSCIFDSCVNLSQDGAVKLLGTSGFPTEGGHPVSGVKAFAIIDMNLVAQGTADFSFAKAQVVNASNKLEDRNGIGLVLTIASDVPAVCGNGVKEAGEDCDKTDLGGESCVTRGFVSGTLSCSASCKFVATACSNAPPCGNNVAEEGQKCDGTDLKGQTCESMGYLGGTLKCNPECNFDVSGCTAPVCGNGIVEDGEQCDSGNTFTHFCPYGQTSCTVCGTNCHLAPGDVSYCGDGTINGTEQCDDGNTVSDDGCSATCQKEFCGDGIKQANEECDSVVGCSSSCTWLPKELDNIDVSGAGGATEVAVNDLLPLNTWAYFNYGPSENITSPPPIVYKSSDDTIATMEGSRVRGKAPGKTLVTAYYTFNGVTKEDVQPVTVTSTSVPAPVSTPSPPPTPTAPVTVCGNGTCDAGEDATNCPADCAAPLKPAAPFIPSVAETVTETGTPATPPAINVPPTQNAATNTGKEVASENANLYFGIIPMSFPLRTVAFAVIAILFLSLLFYALGKRLKKPAEIAPEIVPEVVPEVETTREQPPVPVAVAPKPGQEAAPPVPVKEEVAVELPAETAAHEEAEAMKQEVPLQEAPPPAPVPELEKEVAMQQ